jgi:hypothetical protein
LWIFSLLPPSDVCPFILLFKPCSFLLAFKTRKYYHLIAGYIHVSNKIKTQSI